MEIISEHLLFNKHGELKELKIQKDIEEMKEHSFSETPKDKAREKLKTVTESYNNLLEEQREEQNIQLSIYEGTLDFLITENLISQSQNGYRLTSKSFSHLNKTFGYFE